MTEKVSDVVSQLEAVLAGIWQRVPHSDDCAIRGGFNPEAPCDCDRNTRLQVEIARTVERMVTAAMGEAIQTPPALWSVREAEAKYGAGWAAAFRATQEPDEKPRGTHG